MSELNTTSKDYGGKSYDEIGDTLEKIAKVLLYGTQQGLTQNEINKTKEIVNELHYSYTYQYISPDWTVTGFNGFDLSDQNTQLTHFKNLHFSESSGFKISRDPSNNLKIDVALAGHIKNIKTQSGILSAQGETTIELIGQNLQTSTSGNKITITNPITTTTDLKNVDDSRSTNNDLLMKIDGTYKPIALNYITEIPASRISGGTF